MKASESKVIKVEFKNEDKLGLKPKEPSTRYCPHKYCEVDKDERIVRCTQCDAVLEPFDMIYKWAIEEANWAKQRESNRQENHKASAYARKLQLQVLNLKEEIRKLKNSKN